MSPVRKLDFRIKLLPGVAPISTGPNKMDLTELKELKTWLEDLLVKGFIGLSVSPWGALVLFIKKKDETIRMYIDYRQLN